MTGPVDKPAADRDITESVVRSLLADQHPDLAELPLALLASGWDNAMFRLGDELLVRIPRRAVAAELIAHEQRWLPALADRLPLPIPVPVRIGVPSDAFPWPWSITPHLPGAAALRTPPEDPLAAAVALGGFLSALHVPAPQDAPRNPYRGIPLADRDDRTRDWIDQLASVIDAPTVLACWRAHVAVDRWAGEPVWLHGDLHPNNVIVDQGRVSGVIDFGDITAGDPATDLGIAWMLLPAPAREVFRKQVGVDDPTWARGRGWALTLGLAYLAHSADDPEFGATGLATITAVLADHSSP